MTKKWSILFLAALLLISGCTQANDQGFEATPNRDDGGRYGVDNDNRFGTLGQTENQTRTQENGAQDSQAQSLNVFSGQDQLDQVNAYNRNGQTYVPLMQVLELLNFNVKEENNRVQAGFTDVFIEVTKDSDQATIEGEKVTLSTPVISRENETFISTKDLPKIFGADANVQLNNNRLTITIPEESEDYGFPNDVNLDDLPADEDLPEDVPAVAPSKAESIVRTALKFRDRPYVFGAPSGETRVFDCSSFTQYVYGVHGIDLPRISRHQAKLGRYIPVEDLRQGDLLFFYWPGRFKSNEIVGHVGIYAGSGYMIHSAPNTPYSTDGVQLTNLRTNEFRYLYLGAKRVGK
jgi:cell wall-associated NlpC family hydrolase